MKSLVIYHSRYGNTERVAQAVADGLGERGACRAVEVRHVQASDVAEAQLLVLGAPTQFGGVPRTMRRFLRRLGGPTWFGRPVAVFDTRFRQGDPKTDSAAVALSARLQGLGAMVVVPPESFFVTGMKGPLEVGEIERARVWARRLHLGDRVPAVERE